MLVRLVSPSAQGVNMYSLSVSLAYMLPWRRLMSWRIQNGAQNNPPRIAQPARPVQSGVGRFGHNFWLNETRQNEIQGGPPLQGRLNPLQPARR
jgi:hypothetical protein